MGLLNFEEAAALLKISSTHLEDCLRANKIFCSIELDGEFLTVKTEDDGSGHCRCKPIIVSPYQEGSRNKEFLILNYSKVFRFGYKEPFYTREFELKRFKDDGLDYQHKGHSTATKNDLRISQEQIDRFKAERGNAAAACIVPERLCFATVASHEPVDDIEIPKSTTAPTKQYPGRINSDRSEPVTAYINRRTRNDKPPATTANLVYELRGEFSNKEIGYLLDIGTGKGAYRKNAVQKLFTTEAERLGTAEDVIKGRKTAP